MKKLKGKIFNILCWILGIIFVAQPVWANFIKQKPQLTAVEAGAARAPTEAELKQPYKTPELSFWQKFQIPDVCDPFVVAEETWGVDWRILKSMYFQESSGGINLGSKPAFKSLPADQLRPFLYLCLKHGWNPLKVIGGITGELGPFQFLPGTWLEYEIDADWDGRADPFSLFDALAATCIKLNNDGFQENPRQALIWWNGDEAYADEVIARAEKWGYKPS